MPLEPVTLRRLGNITSAVVGIAHIECPAEPCDHSEIRVEALLSPLVAHTGSDGRFRLEVTPGVHTLRFGRDRYRSRDVADVAVGEGELVRLEDVLEEEVIVLEGRPGRVAGSVALPPGFDTAERRRTIDLAVHAPGAELDAEEPPVPLAAGRPDDRGGFTLGPLPAARYEVVISALGFARVVIPIELPVGEVVQLGRVLMAPDALNTFVEGEARLEGVADGGHGGTRVEVGGSPLFAITVSDGSFRVPALPGAVDLLPPWIRDLHAAARLVGER